MIIISNKPGPLDCIGVDKKASQAEIKKAYHKKALQCHPDRCRNASEAEKKAREEEFKSANEAYSVLSDQQKREHYDSVGDDMYEVTKGGNTGGQGGHFPGFHNFSTEGNFNFDFQDLSSFFKGKNFDAGNSFFGNQSGNFFNDMFGPGYGSNHFKKTNDSSCFKDGSNEQEVNFFVTLDELYINKTKKIKITRNGINSKEAKLATINLKSHYKENTKFYFDQYGDFSPSKRTYKTVILILKFKEYKFANYEIKKERENLVCYIKCNNVYRNYEILLPGNRKLNVNCTKPGTLYYKNQGMPKNDGTISELKVIIT